MTTALINTNCKLNILRLNFFGGITDKGVKHLTTALTHTNCKLTILSIAAGDYYGSSAIKQITDKAVKHLATALTNNNCKLKSLSLPEGAVSEKSKILINNAAKDKNCAVFYR